MFLIKKLSDALRPKVAPIVFWALTPVERSVVETGILAAIEKYDPNWVPSHDDYWRISYEARNHVYVAKRIGWIAGSELKAVTLAGLVSKVEGYYRRR